MLSGEERTDDSLLICPCRRCLDLNCNCSIAALISGFDNDSNLCPIAFKFHAVVGIFDLSNFFSDLINQICYKTSSLVVCIHSKCCVLLIRTNIGVNIGVSLQSAFFVDMFLFSRKAFATIVAFLP